MSAMRARMRKEIEMLEQDPPYGISAWPKEDRLDALEAQILGPEGSPYENGVFWLSIEVPERYPFEPPKVKFVTPIYHPNIDDAGRICLDTLKMQPKGSWLPSVNLCTLLTTIRLLMAEPNADDGLMAEITDVFKQNRELFNRKATEMTLQHAQPKRESAAATPSRLSQTSSAPTPMKNATIGSNADSDSESDSDSDSEDSGSDQHTGSRDDSDDGQSYASDEDSDSSRTASLSKRAQKRRRLS